MVFQGEVLPIGVLLERAQAAPPSKPTASVASGVGVRHTAAGNARRCAELLAAGESLDSCWRLGILQTLDDYTSTLRRGGPVLAAQVFTAEPPATGSPALDAAFAALADHLAERDGWETPNLGHGPGPPHWGLVSGRAAHLARRGQAGQPPCLRPARHSHHRTVPGPNAT